MEVMHYTWSGTVLFKGGLRLVKNIYCELQDNHKNVFKRSILDMLREQMKLDHIKCSIKNRGGRKRGTKEETKPNAMNREQLETWLILIQI